MCDKSQLLEQAIHHSIPLSQTLEFHIHELSNETIKVEAPLAPNINIHKAAFAGSIYSLGALTAWGLVTHLVSEAAIKANVVIGKAEIFYHRPITESIHCSCTLERKSTAQFLSALRSNKRNKIALTVDIGNHAEATLDIVIFANCVP